MITPTKFTTLDQSVLAKTTHLFIEGRTDISLTELRRLVGNKFSDVGEFILALDVLFILGKIEIDNDKGIMRYVD